jgi:hypothetical protein
MDKKSFKQVVLSNNCIPIDNGELTFVIARINDENFRDISPRFKEQLKNENKYNSWIGFITHEKQLPYTVQMLPIYGRSDKYVTKWFTKTPEETIDQCLKDKGVCLLNRANK